MLCVSACYVPVSTLLRITAAFSFETRAATTAAAAEMLPVAPATAEAAAAAAERAHAPSSSSPPFASRLPEAGPATKRLRFIKSNTVAGGPAPPPPPPPPPLPPLRPPPLFGLLPAASTPPPAPPHRRRFLPPPFAPFAPGLPPLPPASAELRKSSERPGGRTLISIGRASPRPFLPSPSPYQRHGREKRKDSPTKCGTAHRLASKTRHCAQTRQQNVAQRTDLSARAVPADSPWRAEVWTLCRLCNAPTLQ